MLKSFFKNCTSISLLFILCSCEQLNMNDSGNLVPKTVTEDSTIPSLEINGTLLHVEDFGNPHSNVVIFLHGGPGGDCNDFTPYRALADSGYCVVQWDQRGTGLSERLNTSEIGTEMYLEDLRQIIDYYAPSPNQKVVLFGHSWGGMYATFFIDSYGDYNGKIAGAILSEVGGFTSEGILDYLDRIIG